MRVTSKAGFGFARRPGRHDRRRTTLTIQVTDKANVTATQTFVSTVSWVPASSEVTTRRKTMRGAPSGPSREIRRRPTLPGSLPPSTIGAGGLNFRVRNGNGCDPTAMATETCCQRRARSRARTLENSIANTNIFC